MLVKFLEKRKIREEKESENGDKRDKLYHLRDEISSGRHRDSVIDIFGKAINCAHSFWDPRCAISCGRKKIHLVRGNKNSERTL